MRQEYRTRDRASRRTSRRHVCRVLEGDVRQVCRRSFKGFVACF